MTEVVPQLAGREELLHVAPNRAPARSIAWRMESSGRVHARA